MGNNAAHLVRRFQTGDREAFAELVRRYQNYVASIAYSPTGDFARSEDIAQPTFLTAWQRSPQPAIRPLYHRAQTIHTLVATPNPVKAPRRSVGPRGKFLSSP
ncbi:MAG: hypothetical protein D6753_05130 [Planctomycetota bacterium]|nr:MAG: hypothetical protein D6753_05130 [Planctomycetota bacterium]